MLLTSNTYSFSNSTAPVPLFLSEHPHAIRVCHTEVETGNGVVAIQLNANNGILPRRAVNPRVGSFVDFAQSVHVGAAPSWSRLSLSR
jgi:hypothetical protein